jgi:hypothetical protein
MSYDEYESGRDSQFEKAVGESFVEMEQKLKESEEKLSNLQVSLTKVKKEFWEYQELLVESKNDMDIVEDDLNDKIKKIDNKIDQQYGKFIEILGIFIAIFAFIIVGIQSSFRIEGDFLDRLLYSTSIFIPITLVLVILILLTRPSMGGKLSFRKRDNSKVKNNQEYCRGDRNDKDFRT